MYEKKRLKQRQKADAIPLRKDDEEKYKPSKRKVPERRSSGEMDVYQRFKKF